MLRVRPLLYLTNNGPKVAYPPPEGCALNTLEIPGIAGTYEALQFHVHTSSEHTIDGSFFGAELHVVHKDPNEDRYAVVGFVIDPSAPEDDALFPSLLTGWSKVAAMTDEDCGMGSYTVTVANSFARTRNGRFRLSPRLQCVQRIRFCRGTIVLQLRWWLDDSSLQ